MIWLWVRIESVGDGTYHLRCLGVRKGEECSWVYYHCEKELFQRPMRFYYNTKIIYADVLQGIIIIKYVN